MADGDTTTLARTRPDAGPALEPLPPRLGARPGLNPDEFREAFGEDLTAILNLDNWRAGRDLGEEYRRIEAEVQTAVQHETQLQRQIRDEVHPRLSWPQGAPKGAGRYRVR